MNPRYAYKIFLLVAFIGLFLYIIAELNFQRSELQRYRNVKPLVISPVQRSHFVSTIRKEHLVFCNTSRPSKADGTLSPPNLDDDTREIYSKVIESFNSTKRERFFVEYPASEDTLYLERMYNWSGLLLEGHPVKVKKLRESNTRHAWIGNFCLSPVPYPATLEMTEDAEGDFTIRRLNIECYPLDMALQALGKTQVDFLSITMDDAMLNVLQTIPLGKIRLKAISVDTKFEHRRKIKWYLESHGYKRIKIRHSSKNLYLKIKKLHWTSK